jgi:integrase
VFPAALPEELRQRGAPRVGSGSCYGTARAARTTAATNALDAGADIAKVQGWLGHANISITRVYDHRKSRPEESAVFKVKY